MPTHDFSRLSAFDFEELICDLLGAAWKTRLEIFTAGRDSGIDLRAFADTKTETIIQCKHVPASSFSKLLSQLRREELPKINALAPSRYVLVTSLGLSPQNKKTLVKLLSPFLKRQSDVLGRTEINSLLRRYPKIETNNFKLWLTSTAVLQRVLYNAEHCQTEFEVERVRLKLPLFVQNHAFPRAQKILDDTRIVVISGEPGIGKTTLADMLLFAHLEQGFEPVVIQGGIEEAKKLFDKTRKQLFYFDDFLGQTFLHDRPELLAKNQDAALVSFMAAVRSTRTSRFILTTREHILRKAMTISERIGSSSLLDHRCILELNDYSFGQKARILYNHLYFSDLPVAYKQAVTKDDFYFDIIRHQNFNPRLIEWLSGYVRVRTVPADDYCAHIALLLESPARIWLYAFDQQISEAARNILFVVGTSSYGFDVEDLEESWQALHQHKSHKYNYASSPRDFRTALSDLEGSFIAISPTRIDFINPSIRDFVEHVYQTSKEHLIDVIESAVRYSQITALKELAEERPSQALNEVFAPHPVVLGALRRLIGSPYMRWRVESDGRYLGTYIDEIPENRLRALIKWTELTKAESLLEVIVLAIENLHAAWKLSSMHISSLVHVLEEFEASLWVSENGGEHQRRELFDHLLKTLESANRYEWDMLLAYKNRMASHPLWTDNDRSAFERAFRQYRLRGAVEELEYYEGVSELEAFERKLLEMQKEHRVSFKGALQKVRAKLKEQRAEGQDDDSEEYESVPTSTKKHDPENEDEVRRLFGSLIS